MTAAPVAHPALPVVAERGGTQLRAPRATVIVDTREQNPFSFARFKGWFAGVVRKPLEVGDYSIAGLEDACAVERKDLTVAHTRTVTIMISRVRISPPLSLFNSAGACRS